MGRTRMGTLREKREAERARSTDRRGDNEAEEETQDMPRAYDEVLYVSHGAAGMAYRLTSGRRM